MVKAHAYFKIIRPSNAFMTAMTVFLGWWLSESQLAFNKLLVLIYAAVVSLSYGNVINDIVDLEADRINRPHRPIPSGAISIREAAVFACILAASGLTAGFLVSPVYGMATLIPVLLLSLYSWRLKATPLFGNLLVSTLVAYALVYGGLSAQQRNMLWGPAALAFLINLCREIIKDLQDAKGDSQSGVHTTASLPRSTIASIIITISLLYGGVIWLPFLAGFGHLYLFLVLATTLPIHLWWLILFFSSNRNRKLGTISALLKIELLGGLVSLSADRLF